ncbi:Fc receptor-like protein 5 isoform X2 [Chanos chanos]|uniref:Fc receptor-like protein 5 isoform X2 n=1 Tax=Chanos chanos TaxID=29144 RepID=A0A6J2V738_CHACN|nr:Fc receptor-like protein 5 isoform X2 [Chanos chanos]
MGKSVGSLLLSVFVLVNLSTETGGSAHRPILSGPNLAYVNTKVEFQCEMPGLSIPVSFKLFRNNEDLVATRNSTKGRSASFQLQVKEGLEGRYYCRVTAGGQTGISNMVHLQVVIPVSGVSLLSDPNPPIIYEGTSFTLYCEAKRGTRLFYTWYHNKQNVTASFHLYHFAGNSLIVRGATEKHAGKYSCLAGNKMEVNARFSGSNDMDIVVKTYLSVPKVSFTLFKEGSDFRANVSCWSTRGSPPVTFTLLLEGREVDNHTSNSLEAWFSVPVTVGMDMGVLQCRAQTDSHQVLSDPVDLEVAPVGGQVSVQVQYLYTADSRLATVQLQCVLTRGTLPAFSWSYNRSPLPKERHPSSVIQHGPFLFLTDITPENSGYYRCMARDSFDANSSWVESEEALIKVAELGVASIEIIAVGFCCLLLLVLVGSVLFMFCTFSQNLDDATQTHVEELHQSDSSGELQVPVVETEVVEICV